MDNHRQLTTPAVDLLAPPDRFASSSRAYALLHRWHLVVRRFWWLPALIFLGIAVPVYFYSAEMPPAYESKARLWLSGKINLSEGRLYTEEVVDYLGTQAELLNSSAVQRRALDRLRAQAGAEALTLPAASQPAGFRPVARMKELVKRLIGAESNAEPPPEEISPFTMKVNEASKSSILELRVTGPTPAGAQTYLSNVIQEYFAFKKENREGASERTLASVTGEIRQLATELKGQQEKLHAFQSSNNVVFLQEQGNSAGSYLAQLNRQIASLQTQLNLLQMLDPDQWTQAESRRGAANSGDPAEINARDTVASLAGPQADLFRASQQMQLLKTKRDELARFLQPEHPKIKRLNEDISTQEKMVQISRDEALRQLANRRQSLQWEIKNLQAAFQEWDLKAIETSRKMADYDRMRLDLQRLQAAYDRLQGVMQTVDVGKAVDQENVGILDPASKAKPVHRLLRNMAVAVALALALCVAAIYLLGLLDDRFATLSELSGFLSEDVLGQVPAISLKDPKGRLGPEFLERQRFEFLESFRNIRSALLFMPVNGGAPKTILITSSVPREGKSTVALYLAATMALGNSRVLLVDADMRRGSQHRFFNAKQGPGLAEVLGGEVLAARAVVPSGMDNLWLLPAGNARRNPGELVLSPAWSSVLNELAPEYDLILIDSPPLLATDDAAALAPRVDGVLMVVRGSFTSARTAQRALTALRRRQARVLGLVFNRVPASAYEYSSYQRYEKPYRWNPQPAGRNAGLLAGTVEPKSAG